MQASITAALNELTSKPEKSLSAIFITMASTMRRTKKERKKSVTKFKGKRRIAPMVAFKNPITNATSTAVPKLLILTEGIILDASNNTPAFISNCTIQFIVPIGLH